MKVKEFLAEAEAELKAEKKRNAIETMKQHLYAIECAEEDLEEAQKAFQDFLDTDMADIAIDGGGTRYKAGIG